MLNISVDGSEQLLRSHETRGLRERGDGGGGTRCEIKESQAL